MGHDQPGHDQRRHDQRGHDQRRHDLETLAFGESATPAERQAARHALAQLGDSGSSGVAGASSSASSPSPGSPSASSATSSASSAASSASSAASSASSASVDPPASPDHLSTAEPLGDSPPDAPRAADRTFLRRSRLAAPLVVVLALGVGLLAGAIITTHLTSLASKQPRASASSQTSAGGSSLPGASTSAGGDPITRAIALLATKPIAADKYPTTFDLNETFVPSSTRLVATAGSDIRIFIARQVGTNPGFCLLSATIETTGVQSSGSATCATPKEFAAHGMLLGEDAFTVTWVGGTITVDLGPRP